ncbi:hypothetical protein BS47DRAFT_1399558 [Hydnum rufescens UP504]|uniref:Uncharacterized protein n=1 Tax=Hydnum rufescens UP504 TaxID=1448309 RepID=A0A9P6DQ80_9AGAM|nr:hypothetical protein BS47DRAFT_1399558 [Hydnum rufescens UP504]
MQWIFDDSSNTKDGSAMDVDDPQSDPSRSLLPLVPPRSSISAMRNQTPAPTTLTSTMHQIMPRNPRALCVITATHLDWDLENRFLGLDSHRNVVHVDSRGRPYTVKLVVLG